MTVQTMEQKRARFALEQTRLLQAQPSEQQKALRSYINQLPAMIHMNGLGQALAFFHMKGQQHKMVYDIISHWLCEEPGGKVFDQTNDILDAITCNDMTAYMRAQNEALALLEWLKKFALAFLEKGDD